MNTRHLFAFNAHCFINLYARARGEMLSRTVTFNLSRGCLLLLESRLSTVEYSELKKTGPRVPELATINEIKVNLQELVQSSKTILCNKY